MRTYTRYSSTQISNPNTQPSHYQSELPTWQPAMSIQKVCQTDSAISLVHSSGKNPAMPMGTAPQAHQTRKHPEPNLPPDVLSHTLGLPEVVPMYQILQANLSSQSWRWR